MKKIVIFFVLTIAILSCKSRIGKYEKIELMAYNWSYYNDTTREMKSIFLKCRRYAEIDEYGIGYMYFYKGYPKPESHFISADIDKMLILKILKSAKTIDSTKLAVLKREPLMYDGPILKLRITYSNKKQELFDFIDYDYGNEIDNLIMTFHYMDSIFKTDSYKPIIKTTDLERSKLQFIESIISYDTLHFSRLSPPSQVDSI
jgi:hypothetical protein